MSEHLSVLELEEAAAGLPPAEHLGGCADCQKRVDELKGASQALMSSPQFAARLAEVQAQAAEKPIARIDPETGELTVSKRGAQGEAAPAAPFPWWKVLVPAFSLAASLALVLFWPRAAEEDTRLKGAVMIRVVGADGRTVEKARPGQLVELAVAAGGRAQGLVLAVDARGELGVLWPPEATLSGRLPPGAGAHLQPGFEVTPGSLKLFALFSDGPFDVSAARARVQAALAEARAAGKSPLQAELPADDGAPAASVLLQVEQ